jgi:ABC-2 type transport system permease protein
MNKTLLIIKREYLTRVTKKSFLILTLLMPLLMGVLMFLPAYLATRESKTENKVAVVDRSSLFLSELQDGTSTKFTYIPEEEYQTVKDNLAESGYYALLEIPQNILTVGKVLVYSDKQVNIDVKSHIDWQIENTLEKQKRAELVNRLGIPDLEEQMQNTKASISVETIKLGEDGTGKKSSTEIAMGIGYAIGFIIYIFVFMYGNMVMRGVLEEKQSRIVEVIISSVKPIQLMMGKILGIAAVGITQVLIWIVLMVGIFFGAKSFFLDDDALKAMAEAQTSSIMATTGANADMAAMTQAIEPSQAQQIFEQIEGINFPLIIGSFIVFFILGYLLYSSLMAAVASAVDSEEDMQQFMLPVTMPLIAAIVVLMNVIKNPEGSLAFWASHIPFTSPIIMMVRIPFGVAWWEILISMAILAVSTYGCVWMAARIYRTGILMYGKKPTWKELGKWLTFKS